MQTKGQPKARRDSKTGKQYYPVKVFSGVDKKNVSVPKEEVLKVFKKLPETVEELQSCRKIFKERYRLKNSITFNYYVKIFRKIFIRPRISFIKFRFFYY